MFGYCLVLSIVNVVAASRFEFALRPVAESLNEGYVELRVDATWGIMSYYFSHMDETTSRILCNTLGFGSVGFSTSSGVELDLPSHVLLWDKVIRCNGNEGSATECFKSVWQNTGHWVKTLPRGWTKLHCVSYHVTDIRLYGGAFPHEGKLEVKVDNRWGSICHHFYDSPGLNMDKLCSILGYVKYGVPFNFLPLFDDNIQPGEKFWMTSLHCEDTDADINECSFIKGDRHYCLPHGHSMAVILQCMLAQLVNGTTPNSGIVEVGLFGKQQMLCASSNISMTAANVICVVLGYRSIGKMSAVKPSSDNTGVTFSGSIHCNGTKPSLELCDIVPDLSGCEVSTVVYIECLGGPIDIIPIGNKSNEGVFTTYNWNTLNVIASRSVTNTTAKTLCNLLGHGYEGSSQYFQSLPESVPLPEHKTLEDLDCYGNETDIAQCRKTIFYPCGRGCPLGPSLGFIVLTCAECQPGYFGTRCTECDCNHRSTSPCDIDTGECTCQNGWYGTSCEYDIDECVTTTCPNNSDCTNSPGSYECICRQGYIRTDDVCEKALESNNIEIPLVILLSSITGFLLIVILTVIIVYRYRRTKKGNGKSPDQPDTTSKKDNELAVTHDVTTDDYSTIKDCFIETKLEAMKDGQKTEPIESIDGYLRPVNRSQLKGKMTEPPDNGYDDCTMVMNNNSDNPYTDLDNAYASIDENGYLQLNKKSAKISIKTNHSK